MGSRQLLLCWPWGRARRFVSYIFRLTYANQILSIFFFFFTGNRSEANRLKVYVGFLGELHCPGNYKSDLAKPLTPGADLGSNPRPAEKDCDSPAAPTRLSKCHFRWTGRTLPKGKVKSHRACQSWRVCLPGGGGQNRGDQAGPPYWQRGESFQVLPSGIWSMLWPSNLGCVFLFSLSEGTFYCSFPVPMNHWILAVEDVRGTTCFFQLWYHQPPGTPPSWLLSTQEFLALHLNQSIWDGGPVPPQRQDKCVCLGRGVPLNTWGPKVPVSTQS